MKSANQNILRLKPEPVGVPVRIAWLEIFETGLSELDAWHQKLIQGCDELLTLTRQGAPWAIVTEKAGCLTASCVDHFRFESAMMRQYGFPRREAHLREHRCIERNLAALVDKLRAVDGTTPTDRALVEGFQSILVDLMVRHDLDYRSHLLNHLGR